MDLQVLFYEVIKHFDCTIIEGHRNKEEQEKAFVAGFSKAHWPDGKHNSQPSMAVDVAPYPTDWNNKKRFYFFAGFVKAIAQKLKDEGKITHGIKFGADIESDKDLDDEGLCALVHFELIV